MKALKIFSDYKKIDLSTPKGRMQFCGAITTFMRQPVEVQQKLIEMGTTQFTSTADVGEDVRVLIERYHLDADMMDVGYQAFFDVRDFSGTPAPGFRMRSVQSGLTFSRRPEGGKAEIYRVTGAEIFVPFDMYGGGLEFDQAWFDDQQWWMIEDTVVEFRSKWYRDKATVFYDLIGSIGAGQNLAWQGAAGDPQLDRDIQTLNTAAANLLVAANAAGYSVSPQQLLYVLSPIQLKGRLERALAAQYINAGVAGAARQVEYNIKPIYSLNVRNAGAPATNIWYMGIPGLLNKIGEKMPLTVLAQFNIEAFATTAVGWGRYGANLNEAQFLRLATA
jgi:hypothetical protein